MGYHHRLPCNTSQVYDKKHDRLGQSNKARRYNKIIKTRIRNTIDYDTIVEQRIRNTTHHATF
jgi:hypothetical protein